MPTAFRRNGFRFFFWSNEEDRAHVHIQKGDGNAKYWLEPNIQVVFSYGYTATENRQIASLIKENYKLLMSKWNEHEQKKNS